MASKTWPTALFAAALLVFHFVFSQFFLTSSGMLGHDYSFFLPALLDGYLWFRVNGILSIPWFTPSFCGGQVFVGDPQSIYFSLPQFLTFIIDPVSAVYLSHILMISASFWGMFLLCRQGFKLSLLGASVSATIFMFNGFFSHRMIVGHLSFQSLALIPLIAYLLTAVPKTTDSFKEFELKKIIFSGLLITYCFQSGLATLMVPSALATIALAATLDLSRHGALNTALRRGLPASVIALALCASKFVAAGILLKHFPHDSYSLPGFENLGDVIKVCFSALFMPSQQAFNLAQGAWHNIQWAILPHEMAFGVTAIPLIVMLVGLLRWKHNHQYSAVKIDWISKSPALLSLTLILLLPLSLLYYSTDWNAFLKSVPIVNSTVSPIRWLVVVLPLLAVWTGLAIEHLKIRRTAAMACLIGVPLITALEDRSFYHKQVNFDSTAIVSFYQAIKAGRTEPSIFTIADARDPTRTEKVSMDALVRGESPLWCYNPLYGYRLESFQAQPLREGPIMQRVEDGYLNLRNPACLLYPEENGCKLWEAFRVDQRNQAERFASYRPFEFSVSPLQRAANIVTQIALVTVVGLLLVFGIRAWRKRIYRPTNPE